MVAVMLLGATPVLTSCEELWDTIFGEADNPAPQPSQPSKPDEPSKPDTPDTPDTPDDEESLNLNEDDPIDQSKAEARK